MTDFSDKPNQPSGEVIIYRTDDGLTKLSVNLREETVWPTQAQIVELYQTSKANVSEHIKHVFEERELEEKSVVRNLRTTQQKTRPWIRYAAVLYLVVPSL